ncbi:hypothetical protein B0T21DRAFT_59349 [Apiosordaria backusii]|uniref:Uncharacterized protein n=1 Tax=Apiosordaria backusii TaxID=314023 RepID=A0AA40AN80_9PEZI|nr:hypothetical protein B0T21DRAFT_59349 [Apiosordaria backusii]
MLRPREQIFDLGRKKNNVKGVDVSLAALAAKEPVMIEKALIERQEWIDGEETSRAQRIMERIAASRKAREARVVAGEEQMAREANMPRQIQMSKFALSARKPTASPQQGLNVKMVTAAEQQARARARASDLINQKFKRLKADADQRVQKAREALRAKEVSGMKTTPKPTRILPPPPALGGRQGTPIASTPTSRSSTANQPPTPASSRVLAPMSASRLNTPRTKLPPIKSVKIEPGSRPAASTPRGVKRKVAEVIDLTLDED